MDGLVNLLVVLALMYVLIKIPFWILGPLRVSSGRSLIGGLARAYVMGRALGAIAGHHTGRGTSRRGGQAGATRTNAAADPPWPAPIREWGGMDGIYSPDAIGRRLHAQQAAERSRAGTTSEMEQPRFLQPSSQVPTHDLATGHTTTAPAGIEFRAANGTVSTPSGQPVPSPRPRHRGRAPRRYPPFSTPGAPTARRPAPAPPPPMRVAPVPPELQFQPATPDPPSTPLRASGPPQPPVFQPATPDRGATGRRARTHTPAPVQFIAARPPAPPAPPSPLPSPLPSAGTPAADATPPPRPRPTRRGGDPR